MKNLTIWLKYTLNAFKLVLNNRATVLIFTTGKTLRIVLFLLFLTFLFNNTNTLGEYTKQQIIFFYLSFNLVDTLSQFFFREVYRFRPLIVSGDFDLILTKPLNPLIRVLLGGADVLDLIQLFLINGLLIWYGSQQFSFTIFNWLSFFSLIITGLLISAGFHILVLAFGILTTSVDHLIMVYRDLTSLMRIPADLYIEPLRTIITFVLPLAIIYTLPAKFILRLTSTSSLLLSPLFAIIALFIAHIIWRRSLRSYSSASS